MAHGRLLEMGRISTVGPSFDNKDVVLLLQLNITKADSCTLVKLKLRKISEDVAKMTSKTDQKICQN